MCISHQKSVIMECQSLQSWRIKVAICLILVYSWFWLSMLMNSKTLMSERVLGRHPEKELYSSPSPQGGTRAALPVAQSFDTNCLDQSCA